MQAGNLFITLVVIIIVDAALLFAGLKMIAKVQLPIKEILWLSLIIIMVPLLVCFGLAFFLSDHLSLVLILSFIILFFFQSLIFQIAVIATGQTLTSGKAYILSLLIILANFFVSSPIIALIVGDFKKSSG